MSNIPPEKKEYEAEIFEDIRPWGKFRSFPHQQASSIKIITVAPGGILSLQYHQKRSEFWIALDDGLEITVGEKIWRPAVNEEIFIPVNIAHRVRNLGKEPARILEIWLGPSAENDIVRLQDSYGRD